MFVKHGAILTFDVSLDALRGTAANRGGSIATSPNLTSSGIVKSR